MGKSKLTEDLMFQMVFSNPKCHETVKKIIEWATNRKVKKLTWKGKNLSEQDILSGKGVRFDVMFQDSNTKYDIEMQNSTENLEKRARYYQVMMDKNNLPKGGEYKTMKDVIVIYLLTFDYKGYGDAINRDMVYTEGYFDKPVEDGRYTIYMNAVNEGNHQELNAFYRYLMTNESSNKMTENLNQLIMEVEEDPEYRRMHMTLQEINLRNQKIGEERGYKKGVEVGKQEGIEAGKMETYISLCKIMMKNGEPIEKIIEYTGLTIEQIKQISYKQS